jgi:hypothetical protein
VFFVIFVIFFSLLQLIGISCANEGALHVIYVALRVHQVFLVLSLDLYASHHHVVLDVHTFLFLFAIITHHHFVAAHVEAAIAYLVRVVFVLLLNRLVLWLNLIM